MLHIPITAKIHKQTPQGAYIVAFAAGVDVSAAADRLAVGGVIQGQFNFDDPHFISALQRKKAHAMLHDIAHWYGEPMELLKPMMKSLYAEATGDVIDSLADCSRTSARHFISFLIDFCMEWDVPLRDTAINRTDDIDAMLYSALMHKRCIVCGKNGELHHVDVVGMGRNRDKISHLGARVMSLCRLHHSECHSKGQNTFDAWHHVYGIVADERICGVWGLGA